MKKGFKFLFLFLGVLTLGLVLVACSKHEHTFASEWTFNASEHWHKATCEHTDEVSDKASHTFGGWQVRTAPTETSEGVEYRTCSVCSYEETRSVEKTPHAHTFAATWSSNETKHWHAATCAHSDVVADEADHTWGDWETVKEAGYLTKGSRKHTCTVCGETVTEETPARTYMTSSEFTDFIPEVLDKTSGKVTFAYTNGDDTDSMTVEFKGNALKFTTEEGSEYIKVADNKVYTYEAEDGYYQNEIVDENDNIYKIFKDGINLVNAVKLMSASFTDSDDISLMFPAEAVTFAYDATTGVYNVTRVNAPASYAAARELVENLTLDNLESLVYLVKTIKVTSTGVELVGDYPDESFNLKITVATNNTDVAIPEHTHAYSTEWTTDEDGHYHAPVCPCEEAEAKHEFAAHTFGDVVPTREATIYEDGIGTETCTVCGYSHTVIIVHPNHVHTWPSKTAWTLVKPTSTEPGSYTRVCEHNEAHVDKFVLPPLTSTEYTIENTTLPTCTTKGVDTYKITAQGSLSKEDVELSFTVEVPELSENLTHTYVDKYSYDEANDKAYNTPTCSVCNHEDEVVEITIKTINQVEEGDLNTVQVLRGIYRYSDNKDYLAVDYNGLKAEITNLYKTGFNINDGDELTIAAEITSAGLTSKRTLFVSHPSYAVTLTGSATSDLAANLTNGETYEFTLTSTENGKKVASVDFNGTKLVQALNGKYSIKVQGPVNLTITNGVFVAPLTDLSSLDFDTYEYALLIGSRNVDNKGNGVLLNGKAASATISANSATTASEAVVKDVLITSDGLLTFDGYQNNAFVLLSYGNGYAIKSTTDTPYYIGCTSSSSLNTSENPFENIITINENGYFVTCKNNYLMYNSTSNIFRYYSNQTQKPISLFYYVTKTLTEEEKISAVTGLLDTTNAYDKAKTIRVLNGISVTITDTTGAVTYDETTQLLTIEPKVSNAAIEASIKFDCGTHSETVNIHVKNIVVEDVAGSISVTSGLASGNKTDALYQVTGVVKSIVSISDTFVRMNIKDANVDNEFLLYGVNFDDDVVVVYPNDTVTVLGYLKKYNTTLEMDGNAIFVSRTVGKSNLTFTINDNANVTHENVQVASPVQNVDNGTKYVFVVNGVASGSTAVVKSGTKNMTPTNIEVVAGNATNYTYEAIFGVDTAIEINVKESVEVSGFVKVTSVDDFTDADELIFVDETSKYTGWYFEDKKLYGVKAVIVNDSSNVVIATPSDLTTAKFVKSGNGYKLMIGDKYATPGTQSGELVLSDSTDTIWTISFSGDRATITSGNNKFMFNSDKFSSYTSDSSKRYPQIYKYVSTYVMEKTNYNSAKTAIQTAVSTAITAVNNATITPTKNDDEILNANIQGLVIDSTSLTLTKGEDNHLSENLFKFSNIKKFTMSLNKHAYDLTATFRYSVVFNGETLVEPTVVTATLKGVNVEALYNSDRDMLNGQTFSTSSTLTKTLTNGTVILTTTNSTYTTLGNPVDNTITINTYSENTPLSVTVTLKYTYVFGEETTYWPTEGTGEATFYIEKYVNSTSTVTDTINIDFVGSGDSYYTWSNKEGTSGAIYSGNSYKGGNKDDGYNIQLKSNGSTSGIVVTTSGGTIKSITINWNSSTTNDRTLDVYAKNTAYTAASDLYNNSNKGTKVGSIVKGTSTVYTFTENYTFFGLRSNSGGMNIDSIIIEWEPSA